MQSAIKIIAIVGPTATGKSAFAVELAKKIGGEIISADSRQVYSGLDIGSGKITKKEMRGVPHHLLDVASPRQASFNASKFQKLATKRIFEIAKRGKLPILVGGTGFWLDALVSGQIFPEVPPNPKLRSKLSILSTENLFIQLQKIDPARSQNIDKHNKHRLIRAIEIASHQTASGKKPPGKNTAVTSFNNCLFFGLDLPEQDLNLRIIKRIDDRIKHGMIAEVKKLHAHGVAWKTLARFGLEYGLIAQFLQGSLNKSQLRQQLFLSIRQYAKRQKTWFKRNKKIIWLNPGHKSYFKVALREVQNFLQN